MADQLDEHGKTPLDYAQEESVREMEQARQEMIKRKKS
mgnify:CR=1 FL=1